MNRFWIAVAFLLVGRLASDTLLRAANLGDAAITHAGMVTPDTLAVTLREGSVTLGKLEPYRAMPADQIDDDQTQRSLLIRGGKIVGTLSGNQRSPQRFVRYSDSYSGARADRALLTDVAAWSLESPEGEMKIDSVFRKSRVIDIAEQENRRPEVCFEHTIYLKCRFGITEQTWTVKSADPVIEPYTFGLSCDATVSDAVHVSLAGFRPDDPAKIAVLSCWLGDGGPVDYRDYGLPGFVVVKDATGEVVHRGTAKLLRESDQPADHRGLQGRPDGTTANYAGTPTFELDFSHLRATGRFRVIVQGIGSSRSFPIDRGVYRPIMEVAMEGLAAHRWGETRDLNLIDGTQMRRPAAVPAKHLSYAGVPIFRTAAVYTNANFGDFEPANQGPWKPVNEDDTVVGGYMDAGDFDRNHNHWIVSYMLLDLAERMHAKDRATAERLIDAAVWNLDLWLRLQAEDGGVPSAVEYSEHPRKGEPSWLNTLPLYICAPSAESSLHFAAAAAKAAAVMDKVGMPRADRYASSAASALQWADANGGDESSGEEAHQTRVDRRSMALAELWRATGESTYRDQLMGLWKQRIPDPWQVVFSDGLTALMTVLEMPAGRSQLSPQERERLVGAVKHTIQMNFLDGSTRRSPFRALKNGWVGLSWGNGSWPSNQTFNILRAWQLVDDPEYLSAAVTGMAYAAGGNPLNLVYMTGLHDRSVRNVLHCDTRYSGRVAPRGIPIYGPAVTANDGEAWPLHWHLAGDQTIYPTYKQWPGYETVHEYWNWAMLMEYTVHQSSCSVIYFAGMLDLRDTLE